jgi:hypothetical protein
MVRCATRVSSTLVLPGTSLRQGSLQESDMLVHTNLICPRLSATITVQRDQYLHRIKSFTHLNLYYSRYSLPNLRPKSSLYTIH